MTDHDLARADVTTAPIPTGRPVLDEMEAASQGADDPPDRQELRDE
jgi:hypothetical protein